MSSVPTPGGKGPAQPFRSDIQELRRRAREHILRGAVTPGYQADRDTLVKLYLGEKGPASRLANLLEDLGHR